LASSPRNWQSLIAECVPLCVELSRALIVLISDQSIGCESYA
jgi:hypothetical protein